ncbi:MAG TPA: endonuclease/exonuclease/phosphatase family protein [Draconibacterium sp.]|nr:endonuclease/exonuclease/phosphatase family protein [Draconibacterium sp.]
MKILKWFLSLIVILIVAFVIFYFWSSGRTSSQTLFLIHETHENPTKLDSTFTIMTYNVGYLSGMTNNQATKSDKNFFTNNLHTLEQHLSDTLPDILCFQEIDYDSKRSYHINLHDTLTQLFYPWSVKAINWDNKYVPFPYWPPRVHFGKVLSGQSIMSMWELQEPMREVLEQVASNPFYYNAYYLDRLLVSTVVKHPVQDFLLLNLHTEAFDTLTRNKQLTFVYERIKAEKTRQPLIIAGDFNATSESGEPGLQLFLQDSTLGCIAFHPNEPNYYTFSSENPEERIDYIFYTKKDFEEISGRVMTEYGEISDHLPVMGKLKFRNQINKI